MFARRDCVGNRIAARDGPARTGRRHRRHVVGHADSDEPRIRCERCVVARRAVMATIPHADIGDTTGFCFCNRRAHGECRRDHGQCGLAVDDGPSWTLCGDFGPGRSAQTTSFQAPQVSAQTFRAMREHAPSIRRDQHVRRRSCVGLGNAVSLERGLRELRQCLDGDALARGGRLCVRTHTDAFTPFTMLGKGSPRIALSARPVADSRNFRTAGGLAEAMCAATMTFGIFKIG